MIDRAQLDRYMTAAADGDRSAVDPLFHALWPIVVRYATRFLGDAVLAEDLAQDALIQLFGQLDRYDRDRDALTWTLTITTWQCRTARRRRDRRAEVSDSDRGAAGVIDGNSTIEDRDLVRAALATLETLHPRDIEAIAAVVTDDDEVKRIVAPATFRKRLERALSRFRTSWRSRHGTL